MIEEFKYPENGQLSSMKYNRLEREIRNIIKYCYAGDVC